jgi:DNA-binding CsgD family transcriptional regulator
MAERAGTLMLAGRVPADRAAAHARAGYQLNLAYERFAAGEWDDAVAELEVSIKVAEEVGEACNLVYAHGLMSRISVHRNDLQRAREAADAGDRYREGWGRGHSMSWVAWPRALISEAEGERGQALATMAGLWDWCASSGLVLELPEIGADLVRLALAAGDRARASQVSAAVAELAANHDLAWMTGEAMRCQGLTEDDPEVMRAAAETHDRGSRPLLVALACEDAGSGFARHGQAERARPLLDRAAGLFERLGAARDLARTEALLREAGMRRGRRGSRGRPQFGWDSLTPTEHSVAGLVAEGLSNPQIGERLYISSRTVQTHLAHVFAKLDISARAQLAVEVIRRRRDEPSRAARAARHRRPGRAAPGHRFWARSLASACRARWARADVVAAVNGARTWPRSDTAKAATSRITCVVALAKIAIVSVAVVLNSASPETVRFAIVWPAAKLIDEAVGLATAPDHSVR